MVTLDPNGLINRLNDLFYGNEATDKILLEIEAAQTSFDVGRPHHFRSSIMTMVGFAFQTPSPKHKVPLGIEGTDEICELISKLLDSLGKYRFNPLVSDVLPTADEHLDDTPLVLGSHLLDDKYSFLAALDELGRVTDLLHRLENMASTPPKNYNELIKVRQGRDVSEETHTQSYVAANSIANLARYFREMGVDKQESFTPWIRYFYKNLMPEHFKQKGGNVSNFINVHSR